MRPHRSWAVCSASATKSRRNSIRWFSYRDEYHRRFTESAQTGMAAGNMRNFQAFIDTLDTAIIQQRQLLMTATARVEAAKPEWQRNKQKLGSYEVLQARRRRRRGESRGTPLSNGTPTNTVHESSGLRAEGI